MLKTQKKERRKPNMILADKIAELRKKNGWSQEELAEMLDVSRQSISKWESAQSIPDMNRILKMSDLFGVSTDCLLKDEMELQPLGAGTGSQEEGKSTARPVSMEEASAFLAYRELSSQRISLGVMMCILSPILLIVLSALQSADVLHLSETAAAGLGLVALLLLIGGAVALFITTGLKGQRFEYMEKEEIDTAYGVAGMAKERREKYSAARSAHLVVGVLLCVLSSIPLFVAMICFGDQGEAYAVAAAILLALVAVGCWLIVRASILWGGFQALLQEGDYTLEKKAESGRLAPVATIFWGSATAIFLALSFLLNAWDKTWIVWPVAGVAYGVLLAVLRATKKKA